MRFSTIAAASALALGVSAGRNGTVVTEVVTEYTTYCPEPTTLTHGGNTYTITEATTITLPCPTGCHVTRTLTSAVVTKCDTCKPAPTVPAGNSSAPVVPTQPPTAAPPAPTGTTPAPPAFTGAASQLVVSGGAMAAVFGIAAYLL